MAWLGVCWQRLGLPGALSQALCGAVLGLAQVWALFNLFTVFTLELWLRAQQLPGEALLGQLQKSKWETHSPLNQKSRLRKVIILLVKARHTMVRNQENILLHFCFEKDWKKITHQRMWTQKGWRILFKSVLYYSLDWISLEEHYLHKERVKVEEKFVLWSFTKTIIDQCI